MLHLIDAFVSDIQAWLYVDVVQPLLFKFNLMDYDEDTYDALYWVIVGALQMVLMFVLLRRSRRCCPSSAGRTAGPCGST